ncbi:MAG: MOSC domain-containing protein [Candidatus Tectomicrobia bacterium]
MITVEAIHMAPVKSLALLHPDTVHVERRGIVEDRRLYLIDRQGRLLTQRTLGQLVQVTSHYRSEPEWLDLHFPTGMNLAGPLELGEAVVTPIWGRHVRGRVLQGHWNQALSDFCGDEVKLVRSDEPGQCYDEFPVSIVSQASLTYLSQQAGEAVAFDSRRFRPNFLLRGCVPHEEDEWLGHVIQIGPELRLHVMARDPRCAITTLDPNTGQRDIDTLRLLRSYRPTPSAVYFGVYGIVEHPGVVTVGDVVTT